MMTTGSEKRSSVQCQNSNTRGIVRQMSRRENRFIKLTLLFYVGLVFMNVLACKVNDWIDNRNSYQ